MAELELRELTKSYKKVKALNGFTYKFTNGIYGILGPNGAGKSTLMNVVTQNLKKDSGTILFNGEDVRNMKRKFIGHIGYMPQQQSVYKNLSLLRFMYYMASLKGLNKKEAGEQIEKHLKAVDLWDVRNRLLGGFSGGMKQRALMAQALLGEPDLIILDEPTAGLDPMQRINVRKIISQLGENRIVIISTHIVSDIEKLAKEILVMNHGNLILQRSMGDNNEEELEDMYMRLFGDSEGEIC